jgi:4-amino-4-deoxy-L-arabinose transferase-like glycosyltransferase
MSIALLAVYVFLSIDGLSRDPLVHGDEMWNAAPAYKLATEGVYGSDLFAGYYEAERWTYQFMPLLQLLLAADFAMFGLGVLQIRLLSVAIGVVALWLTFLIGRRVGGPAVGVVSVWLLAAFPIAAGLDTGIVFVDLVRQTRYHVLAAACGLAALLFFLQAEDGARMPGGPSRVAGTLTFSMSGALAGLAFLSHMYGLFWLPALGTAALVRHGAREGRKATAAIFAGFLLTCTPWIVYVAANWPAFVGQMRMYGERFALLTPGFYAQNLIDEIRRYYPFGRRDPWSIGPGTWLALLSFPMAVGRAIRMVPARRDQAVTAVVVSLLVLVGLYALLLKWKTFSYLLTPLPLAAVLVAEMTVSWWKRPRTRLWHGAIVVALVAVSVQAALAVAVRHRRALETTPYDRVGQRLAACVPKDAVVVAPHRYWLALHDRQIRTWVVPLLMTDPGAYDTPVPLDVALSRIDPDVLVLDEREFGGYFDRLADPSAPGHGLYAQLARFRTARHAQTVCTIHDDDYGTIVVDRLTRP